jgi:hypothetical protein
VFDGAVHDNDTVDDADELDTNPLGALGTVAALNVPLHAPTVYAVFARTCR